MKTKPSIFLPSMAIASALSLYGCGGGGSESVAVPSVASTAVTAAGVFKDSNTSGLHYESGTQSGTTGADGGFTYEVGKPVTFSIGKVILGTASNGQSILTPVDLVVAGTDSTPSVQNIVRLLTMLDLDGDPSNGITISTAVATAAVAWAPIDFAVTEAAFTTAIAALKSSAEAADGVANGSKVLLTAAQAKIHLEASLKCARSGAFRGTYAPSTGGTFGAIVDAGSGYVSAIGGDATTSFEALGTSKFGLDQAGTFVSGIASTGAVFNGVFNSPNAISGTWTNTGINNGKFTGKRIGGAASAKHRYTGLYVAMLHDKGLFSFDIDSANAITGVAYNITSNQQLSLSGSLTNGSDILVTVSDGTLVTGTVDLLKGTVSGDLKNGNQSGIFDGTGCRLN